MKKTFSFFKNWNLIDLYTCSLHVIDTTPNSGTKFQVRTLYIKTTNVVSLYVNNKKVNTTLLIKAAPLKNENHIIIKAKGLFNSKTEKVKVPNVHIETTTKPFSEKISLTLGTKLSAINKLKITSVKSKTPPLKKNKIRDMNFQKNYKLICNKHTLKTINTN